MSIYILKKKNPEKNLGSFNVKPKLLFSKTGSFDALNEVFGCEYARGGKYQIGDVEVDTMGLFGIDETVRQMAEKKGIILDSTYCADAPMGLPFHIPYIVSKNGVCGKEMEQQ